MANNYNSDWISKLKSSCDIVDIVRYYVPLEKKGDTYWGNCPFHHEKTPSFAVKQSGQFFHCFGCGVGGNVYTFIQKIESLSFIESAKLLAERVGMKLPEELTGEGYSIMKVKRDLLYSACGEAGRFYHNCLLEPKNKIALEYLTKRGVTMEYIKKFGIGYSPDWTSLIKYLGAKKISKQTMFDCGLVQKGDDDRYYDVMRERVMFPLFNYLGKCVGFSGRSLESNKLAKYKNTKETIIFNKSEFWYGLNFVKKARKDIQINEIIIVEGQMDLIMLHQAGVVNVVATLGTALTPSHAKEIQNIVDTVVLCFDGDGAGQKATMRSIDILKKQGLKVKVMALPENLDPDEYLKKYSAESFVNISKNAQPSNDYIMSVIRKKYDLSTNDGITNYLKESIEFVKSMETHNERELALRQISEQSNISIDILKRDYDNINIKISVNNKLNESSNKSKKALEYITICHLLKKDFIDDTLMDIYNIDDVLGNIYQFAIKNNDLSVEELKNRILNDFVLNKEEVENLYGFDFSKISNAEKYYKDCKKEMQLESIENQINLLKETAKNEVDSAFKKNTLEQIMQLMIQKEKIKKLEE